MPACCRRLLALVMAAAGCAATKTPPVDRDAMREASRPELPDLYASSKAYAAYLRARLAVAAGDWTRGAEELKLALAYDPSSGQLHLALAEVLARAGQIDPAEGEARQALESEPGGPVAAGAHLLLGKMHAAAGKREAAVEELRAAMAAQPHARSEPSDTEEDSVDSEPWHLLGRLYLEAGDEAAAERTFEDLAARLPGEGSGFAEMGRAFLEKRDFIRARKYLAKAVERDRSDLDSARRLGEADEGLGKADDARKDYEAALRLDDADAEALLALGRLALRRGDLAEAQSRFEAMIRDAPDEAAARSNAAFEYLSARKPAEALALVEEGLRSGSDGRLEYVKGVIHQNQRRFADAAKAFGRVQPGDGDFYGGARAAMAACLSQLGRHAEAERALAAPLKAHPEDVRLVIALAQVKQRAGRAKEGVELLRRAVAGGERSGMAEERMLELVEALASGLEKAGRAREAVAVLEKALASRPRDQELIYALGAAYDKSGDFEAGIQQMRALLAIDPAHADALNFVGYSYAERGVNLDEAEKLVGRAIELKPDNGYFIDSLGWVYFKKGDLARAISLLEKADALSGPDGAILEHLGDAYRQAGRPGDAVAAYRRALEAVDPGTPDEEAKQRLGIEKKLKELAAPKLRPVKR